MSGKSKKMTGWIVFAFFGILVSGTMVYADNINVGNTIYLYNGPGTTNGGEFRLFLGGAYQFNTFCMEVTEFFSFGQPLTVAGISNTAYWGSTGQPTGDPLNFETAYLYTMFRNNSLTRLDAYSGAFRTPIPEQSGHLFHLIPDTHSSPFRTLYKV